ncbi:MAG: uncharacterized protein QOF53_1508 [Nocardioidaceae bacterium]|jgi:hypothetical protein|nr:uncharacterized protein [Nocardioidaceae bacterium]
MSGERDLTRLLETIQPELRPGRFVFTTVTRPPEGVDPVALVREDEGVTLVLAQDDADRLSLPYDYVAAMVTLRVHSSLDAVGLTAAVARTLADEEISCNVMSGFFHDHLFVPLDQGPRVVALLRDLAPVRGGR